jgi:hypothetical protein
MTTRNLRMLPPVAGAAFSVNGRTYTASGATLDMPDQDGYAASCNGWQVLGYVGTTAQRPTVLDPDAGAVMSLGLKYIDTTLGKVVLWNGRGGWNDPVTGAPA